MHRAENMNKINKNIISLKILFQKIKASQFLGLCDWGSALEYQHHHLSHRKGPCTATAWEDSGEWNPNQQTKEKILNVWQTFTTVRSLLSSATPRLSSRHSRGRWRHQARSSELISWRAVHFTADEGHTTQGGSWAKTKTDLESNLRMVLLTDGEVFVQNEVECISCRFFSVTRGQQTNTLLFFEAFFFGCFFYQEVDS